MEVMEDSPPGHSIAHALPKTVKHPQWQQVALPTDPDRVSPETCCQLQIKRSHPSLSLAQSRYCLRRCCQCHRINPSRQQLRQHGERDVAGDSVMLRLREMNGRMQTPGSLFFQVVATCRWTGQNRSPRRRHPPPDWRLPWAAATVPGHLGLSQTGFACLADTTARHTAAVSGWHKQRLMPACLSLTPDRQQQSTLFVLISSILVPQIQMAHICKYPPLVALLGAGHDSVLEPNNRLYLPAFSIDAQEGWHLESWCCIAHLQHSIQEGQTFSLSCYLTPFSRTHSLSSRFFNNSAGLTCISDKLAQR